MSKKTQRNFATGIMNKSVDERLLPNGEYSDAMNVRLGSTEASEIGSVENTKGNSLVATIAFPPTGLECSQDLSPNAVCIGSYADPSTETIYWFVHDPTWMGIYPTDSGGAIAPGNIVVGPATVPPGVTTGAAAVKRLEDNTQLFRTTVKVGDIVTSSCGTCTNADYVYVTEVQDDTKLSLSGDLAIGGLPLGTSYTIKQNLQRCDMIVSYNTISQITNLLVVSMWDGVVCTSQWVTTLNFSPKRLITGINFIDNMLFFTDNYNPPRKINITRTYAYPEVTSAVAPSITCTVSEDKFLASDILVIKAPPLTAPFLSFPEETLRTVSQDSFLQDRFISFAYRWKYRDQEYSALSPFSEVAFEPESFMLGPDSMLNEGMINRYSSVNIIYNTGSDEVIGVDIVFKESESNIIKVIEKVDKLNADGGGVINSNQNITLPFSNDKIYTVLPSDEILRLYDNVPRRAKAQTLMGNRLMYSNYDEGYDMTNTYGMPVTQQWGATLGQITAGLYDVPITYATSYMSTYKFGTSFPLCQQAGTGGSSFEVPNQKITLDFANVPLIAGSILRLRFRYSCAEAWNTGGQCWYDPGGQWPATGPTESALEGEFIEFTFTLDKDYDNIEALLNDSENSLKIALGYGNPTINGNINSPLPGPTGCITGSTFTDRLNCMAATQILLDPGGFGVDPTYVYRAIAADSLPCPAAINDVTAKDSQGFADYASATGNTLELKTIPIIYNTDQNLGGAFNPSAVCWPSFEEATCEIERNVSGKSLHSNRSYQFGILYLDEFGRATTALTSSNNTVRTACVDSTKLNFAKINMPPQQLAPSWATNFRFVIKPTRENYETVYCSKVFINSIDGSYWFLLEGENANKVEVGDRLLCKRDSNGPVSSCEYAEVLAKGAKDEAFIRSKNPSFTGENATDDGSSNPPGTGDNPKFLFVPQGVYMQLKNMPFSVPSDPLAFEYPASAYSDDTSVIVPITQSATIKEPYDQCAKLAYRGIYRRKNSDNEYPELPIPEGTVVKISFKFERGASLNTGNRSIYNYNKTFTADGNYNNIYEFWNGLAIGSTLNQGTITGNICNESGINVSYISDLWTNGDIGEDDDDDGDGFGTGFDLALEAVECDSCTYAMRWAQLQGNQAFVLLIKGGLGGGSYQTRSKITATFDIIFNAQTIAFETETSEALPNIWYEGSRTYNINTETGAHLGTYAGNRNQVPGIPGGPDQSGEFILPFFNCFAFGDGIESYKVRDSITGKSFALGNRVTSTSDDYGKKTRFADITYSGVYNDESNVNRLNEFNLGLANFKSLEDSFGHVQVLSGRETDVLVLQEDKISYVLAGKNLLSDSSGGGSVASVPEVLGTQIARVEDYGISKNPESFAEYGFDKYFTDQKRGAVIRLRGASAQSEQLDVISEYGMRGWFRDAFNGRGEVSSTASDSSSIGLNSQKIGGFDPYMNEYVVSLNDNPTTILTLDPCDAASVPDFLGDSEIPDVACGDDISVNSTDTTPLTQNIVLGSDVGQVTWSLVATGANFTVTVNWNDTVAATGTATPGVPLTLTWFKDTSGGAANVAVVQIVPAGAGTLSWTALCPTPNFISTIPIVFNSPIGFPIGQTVGCPAPNSEAKGLFSFQWSDNVPAFGGVVSGDLNTGAFFINYTQSVSIFGTPAFPLCAKWSEQWINQSQGFVGPTDGATMEVQLFDYTDEADLEWESVGISRNFFDVTKCKFLYYRSPNYYAATVANANIIRNAALTAGNIMTLESWNDDSDQWVTAVNGSTRYRGIFTVPTPVAPATDPYLYIIYDLNMPTKKALCYSTVSTEDACCDCECPAGTLSACYAITQPWIESGFGDPNIPAQYNYSYTNPSTGIAAFVNFTPNQAATQGDPNTIYVCSSTPPVLTNATTLPTQANGVPWPFPAITINECFTGTSCTTCP